MTQNYPVRLLFMINLSLQMIQLGNSYQRERHKRSKEEIHNATAQKLWQKTFHWTLDNFRATNGSLDDRKMQDSRIYSQTSQERVLQPPRCCKNGGTCVLGSFCVCPAAFTGRYCEHDQERSGCGALAHGSWTLRGCRLCRCVFAALRCLPTPAPAPTPARCDLQDFLASSKNGQSSPCLPSFLLIVPCLLLQCILREEGTAGTLSCNSAAQEATAALPLAGIISG